MANNETRIVNAIIERVEHLDRSNNYKKEIIECIGDVIAKQRNFDIGATNRIVPEIEAVIDAFARTYDELDEI